MNRMLQTTTTDANKYTVCDNIMLNRELLFTKDTENLWIKYDDDLIPIAGDCKQFKLEAGDNIEILKDEEERSFYLSGENGQIWITFGTEHQIIVSYISNAELASCKLSIVDVRDSSFVVSQQELDFIKQIEEDRYKYALTIENNVFETYKKFYICLQVQSLDNATELAVPQGNFNEPKTWKSFNYGTEVVRLLDDIDINTCTLNSPKREICPWKGTENIVKLQNRNRIVLFMKHTKLSDTLNKSFLGGEILIRMLTKDDKERYGHYAFSCSSIGSWSLKGASETAKEVLMIKALWHNDYYYGLLLPSIITEKEETIYETYSGYDFENLKSRSESFKLRIGTSYGTNKDRDHLEIIDSNGLYYGTFTDTGIVVANNQYRHIQYVSLDLFIPRLTESGVFPENSEIASYYGKGYYLYFDVVFRPFTDPIEYTLRFLGGWICNTPGNYSPLDFPERVVKSFDSKDSDVFEWNPELIRTSGTVRLGEDDDTINLCNIEYKYASWSNNLKRPVGTETKLLETFFEKAEVWFNGWKNIVPDIPTGYVDSEIEYTVLSNVSQEAEEFADTFYVTAPELPEKFESLRDTGIDSPPYRFMISGKVSLEDLEAIAQVCKRLEKQIYLDFSNSYVDNTAENWEDRIFADCISLRGLIVPKGLVSIQNLCFIWCSSLTTLDLSPSMDTLTAIGMDTGWSSAPIVGLFTSTKVRSLIVPPFVNKLTKYLVGTSNVKNLIFLHEGDSPMNIDQWTWMIISSKDNSTQRELPENFHLFITKSWNDNFIASINKISNWQWNNESGWWTPEIINSMVVFEPDWNQEEWKEFNKKFDWGEDLINNIRAKFGYTEPIELKEYKSILD